MRRLLPTPGPPSPEVAVTEVYDDLVLPDGRERGRPWVALGMVATVDGGASVAGRTEGLGGVADHHAFRALRDACDAIVVGAGTVRAEGYGPPTGTAARRSRRRAKGLTAVPRLVVVTGSLRLDPAARVFGDPDSRPIVATTAAAIDAHGVALADRAELLACGDEEVEIDALLSALAARGLWRLLCEGGPTLNDALLAAERVDEVFLTVAPTLVGGDAPRIVHGPRPGAAVPTDLRLLELAEHEGELLLRYRRER